MKFARDVALRLYRRVQRIDRAVVSTESRLLRQSPLFDEAFYLGTYPDVAISGQDGIEHYLRYGGKERRASHPLFDSGYYLDHNPDVAAAGTNPLVHYLRYGYRERRQCSKYFDTEYYLSSNPDVAAAGVDPLLHFLKFGAVEGRDPSIMFHTNYYIGRWPDVAESGLNPLVHYVLIGEHEGRSCFNPESYGHWIRLTDPSEAAMMAIYAQEASALVYRPKVSILMPVYNTPLAYLRIAVESVLRQTYDNWELCVVDDGSIDPTVRETLADLSRSEPRLRFHARPENGGISRATNDALKMATGEFIALLDHDDAIHPCALQKIVEPLQSKRELDMIYSDEDKIDEVGRHSGPFFKPCWSPEYMLSMMYTCHLGLYRRDMVERIGGFRPEFDGAQDFDMVLRLVEQTDRIAHVPLVLYHWRVWSASTAAGPSAKPHAEVAARNALREHLSRRGVLKAVGTGTVPGHHAARLAILGQPLVSVVLPTANRTMADNSGRKFLDNCVESIEQLSNYRRFEFILIHNGDLTEEQMERYSKRGYKLVEYSCEPFNLPEKMAMGVATSAGEQILFLNDDTRALGPRCISALLEFAQLPGVGAVGAKLYFPTGRLQHVGVHLLRGQPGHHYYGADRDIDGYGLLAKVPRNYMAVSGAVLMSPRRIYDQVGGWNRDLPRNYNDVDYCLKIREAGYRIVWTPYSEFIHYEGMSLDRPRDVNLEDLKKFGALWSGRIDTDPYYNANLPPIHLYGHAPPSV